MEIVKVIAAVLLGLLFIITGSFKFFQSREKVIASGGEWASDFAPFMVKLVAATELVSGVLLLLSRFAGIGKDPGWVGAMCISVIMAGSVFVHLRRKEYKHCLFNVVLLLLALFVASTTR